MVVRAALPSRFRRTRVLVVGCGDVGLRCVRALGGRVRVLALTSSPERVPELRQHGVLPLQGNLDAPQTLRRLAGLAQRVLHLAPPPSHSPGRVQRDERTRALIAALARRRVPIKLVYGSTTGVYGDCRGQWVDETRPLAPATPRAQRRVDAETRLRHWGRTHRVGVDVLRIPGIYAHDRPGGARERLLRGTPVWRAADDVYTNHIHADDLARACLRTLWRPGTQRVFHVCDDTDMAMGDCYDLAADLWGLPRPERIARDQADQRLSALTLSFMSESRRLRNGRMRRELRLRLRYPTVRQGWAAF